MSWEKLPLSQCKISYFIDTSHYIEQIYNLNPLLFLGSSADCRKLRLNFSHCSLNHSPIGCLFICPVMTYFPKASLSNRSVVKSLTVTIGSWAMLSFCPGITLYHPFARLFFLLQLMKQELQRHNKSILKIFFVFILLHLMCPKFMFKVLFFFRDNFERA